jgi:hypothetical protein
LPALASGHDGVSPIVAIGKDDALRRLEDALAAGDRAALLAAAGWPRCCAQAWIKGEFSDPAWAFVLASGQGGPVAQQVPDGEPMYWHPLLARLGITLLPHSPCGSDCPASAERALHLRRSEAVDEILDWPVVWSALHGIAEVLLPVAKLVHDTDATADKYRLSLLSDRLPEATPQGVVQPYRPPKRRALRETRAFQAGIAMPRENPLPPLRGIERIGQPLPQRPPEVPALLHGVAQDWSALHRWTLDFLEQRFGDCEVTLQRGAAQRVTSLRRFVADLRNEQSGAWYLVDFGFEHECPDMLQDFVLPPCLESWHFELPVEDRPGLRSLYVGGAGSGVALHVDILQTCAFSTLISGCKHWYFCPPSALTTWLSEEPDLFDPVVRDRLRLKGLQIFEHVQQAGETLFVPSGWWHQTRNLTTSIALTGNILNAWNEQKVRLAIGAAKSHPLLDAVGRQLLHAIERSRC